MKLFSIFYLIIVVSIFLSPLHAQSQAVFIDENGILTPFNVKTHRSGDPLKELGIISDYAISPDGRTMYVTDIQHQTVWPIDLDTFVVGDAIGDFLDPISIAITPDGAKAFVVDHGSNNVKVIDLTTHSVTELNGQFLDPHSVAIAPNGVTAYVTDTGNNGIYAIDIAEEEVVHAPIGAKSPTHIVIGANSLLAFVATAEGGQSVGVTRVDLQQMRSIGYSSLSRGSMADLAMTPDGKSIIVATAHPPEWALVDVNRFVHSTGGFLADPVVHNFADPDKISISFASDGETILFGYANRLDAITLPNISITPLIEEGQFEDISGVTMPFDTNYQPSVYFLGDSVTAGFGYCGSEVPGQTFHSNCNVNELFSNAWTPLGGTWPVTYCKPPEIPDDRCSNNNLKQGKPWEAGAWAAGANAPTIAYSYVTARRQDPNASAAVRNWAITGSEPVHWDPASPPVSGIFSSQLKQIKNSYVVMTLGANPLLAEYLDYELPVKFNQYTELEKGECASTTHLMENGIKIAAPLHDKPNTQGADGVKGIANCLKEKWDALNQSEHLGNIYATLLENGNRVLVMGYPPVCPWSFGEWQPHPNFILGPAAGYACNTKKAKASAHYPNANGGNPDLSQADQAFYLNQYANSLIEDIVELQHNPNIVFVQQSPAWKQNQPVGDIDKDLKNSWVFLNDTWVHPSQLGHEQIAGTVEAAMCDHFGHWCPAQNGATVEW